MTQISSGIVNLILKTYSYLKN